jgi:putative flippase GtrA
MISFFLNRSYTFKVKDKIFIRMFKFFSVAFVGYISSVALLYILIDVMHMNEIAAKFLTLFFVLLIQYTLNKKITFKE